MFAFLERKWLARKPFPAEWRTHLHKRVPWYRGLEPTLKKRFDRFLKVFVWQKHWEGANGFEVTDEVRVTIAAAAVRLVLHLDLSRYDRLTEIVVYPGAYKHPDRDGAVLGEAHRWGTVVLSWPAVRDGLANPHDGHETATHEFAHVLDAEDGAFDGTPLLSSREGYAPWANVMESRFLALRKGKRAEHKVMRDYGETNEAEFFAVATESFFEKPRQMREHTPDLYRELTAFYGFDPALGAPKGAPVGKKIGRNQRCPCGSRKKFKKCCGKRRAK